MSIFDTSFLTKSKTPINQINIVRIIARNGKQSKSKLSEELNKNWSEINDSVKLLLSKKLIIEDLNTKKSKEKFFNLTAKGFSATIWDELKLNDNNFKPITSKQFWNHLSESNYNIQELKDISELYENIILGIDLSNIVPQSFLNGTNNKELHDYDNKPTNNNYVDKVIPITLKLISKNKPMKLSVLLNKLQSDSNSIDVIDIEGLVNDGLILKNNNTYDLTNLGLIELFFLIFRNSFIELYLNRHPYVIERDESEPKPINFKDFAVSKDIEAKKIVKELDRLRLKYVHLLPDIFNGGYFQKLDLSFYEIVVLLLKLYKNLDFISKIEPLIQKDTTFNTFQRFDRTRQELYYRKIQEHLDISEETLPLILQNESTRSLYWLYQNIQEPFSQLFDNFSHNQIQKKITFDFYCIYKAYCNGWNEELLKSQIKKSHDQEIRTLLDFSKNYIKNIELSLN